MVKISLERNYFVGENFVGKELIFFEAILQVLVNVHQGCLNLKRCNEECRLVYFPTFHFIMLEYCKIGLFRRQKWFAELRSQVFLYHFHKCELIFDCFGYSGLMDKMDRFQRFPTDLIGDFGDKGHLFLIDRSIYQLSCIF